MVCAAAERGRRAVMGGCGCRCMVTVGIKSRMGGCRPERHEGNPKPCHFLLRLTEWPVAAGMWHIKVLGRVSSWEERGSLYITPACHLVDIGPARCFLRIPRIHDLNTAFVLSGIP